MKCLFIIDVQNGFVSTKTSHIIPKIIQLVNNFNEGPIIATKFINQAGSPFETIIRWGRLRTSPETDVLTQISASANHIFEKPIYSACTDEVKSFLQKERISEAYIAGIDTDCCVLKTATDLFELGIRPVVLADYCASNGGDVSHKAAITVMERTIGLRQILHGPYTGQRISSENKAKS